MLKKLATALFLTVLMSTATPPDRAQAQDINAALSRLKDNPRYAGRVLGTHLRRDGGSYLYEVRILRRRDDRVVLVFIDPDTGRVVGDSESSARRPSKRPPRGEKRRNKNKRDRRER